MEKVKVTKAVADAIEYQLSVRSKEALLRSKSEHLKGRGHFMKRSAVLNALSFDELAIALYVGYVVDKTPEERILDAFLESPKYTYSCGCDNREFGRAEGIKLTLDTLGISIKGVNA